MKKLVSLIMVLALVLGLAVAVSAAGTGTSTDPFVIADAEDLGTVDLANGEIVWYQFPEEYDGWTLKVTAPMSFPGIHILNPYTGMAVQQVGGYGEVTYTLNAQNDRLIVGVNEYRGNSVTATLELEEPALGSPGKPVALTDIAEPIEITTELDNGYSEGWCFYTYTCGDVGGAFTVTLDNVVLSNPDSYIQILDDYGSGIYADEGDTEYTWMLMPGQELTFRVWSYYIGDTITFSCNFEAAELGTLYNPIVIEDQAKPYSFDVELKTESYDYGGWVDTWTVPVYYKLSDVEGAILTIEDPHAIIEGWGDAMHDMDENDDVLNTQLCYLENGEVVIGVLSQSVRDEVYTVTVSEPKGFDENPEVIDDIAEIEAYISSWMENGPFIADYYYNWTATESGKLSFSVSEAEWHDDLAEMLADVDVPVELTVLVNGKEAVAGTDAVSLDVAKGDVVTLAIAVAPLEGDQNCQPAYVTVAGSIDPLGSESNPIRVNAALDLAGIDVAAGGKTYVAINSQLNGQILTINGDANTVVTLNGKELTAVNGVFTAELTGTPVNALIVTNKGTAAATYTASINYALGTAGNPIAVTTEQGVASKVEAGAEVHYLLNSKMSGAVLSVKGEGAYVIVDGVKTEAKDGVIKLTLKAEHPTISLVIGNTGSAAATVVLSYTDNPNTGDLSILAPAAALLVSAMGTVALVIKKKEF